MKQGRASSSGPGSRKIEPIVKAINPGGVAEIGSHKGTHVTGEREVHGAFEKMHAGRGFTAPHDAGRTVHKGGSQRRH